MAVNPTSLRNLKHFTKDTASEFGRRGNKASIAPRKERKIARELMKELIAMPADELDTAALESMGVEASDINQLTVMLVAVLRKAQSGDIRAVELVLSLIGELPASKQEITGAEGTPLNPTGQVVILELPDNHRD